MACPPATTRLELFYDYPMAFRPLRRIASGDGCGVCGILGILGVIASGHWALCGIGEHVPEMVFGEIGRDPLERVWRETPVLRQLREGLPERLGGVCGNCLMRHRCLGSCVAQNFYRAGDLFSPFWFCEEARRTRYLPVQPAGRALSDLAWRRAPRPAEACPPSPLSAPSPESCRLPATRRPEGGWLIPKDIVCRASAQHGRGRHNASCALLTLRPAEF